MLARSILLPVLCLLLLAGCMADPDNQGFAVDDPSREGELMYEGESTLYMLPNSMEQLRVRYLSLDGRPVAGAQLEFAFLGLSGSSFLPTAMPVTDGEGLATTTLSVGSSPPQSFQVRVSAQGAEPLFIDVKVVDATTVLLSVAAKYDGMRIVESRTVSKIAGRTCAEALEANVLGDPSITYEDKDYRPVFELGAGVSYAVLAWGRDSTNAKITVGCEEFAAPITDDEAAAHADVEVHMADIPMAPAAKPYPFTLDLDVSVSVARLGAAMRARAAADFPVGEGRVFQGDYYAGALRDQLVADGEDEAAADLAARRTEVAEQLELALQADERGLAAYVNRIAERAEELGAFIKLDVVYGIGVAEDVPMSITLAMVRARNAMATETLMLDKLGALDIKTLSIDQPLGGYGKALISALAVSEESALAEVAGCDVVSAFIADDVVLAPACDEDCQRATCERARASLRVSVAMDLLSFDVTHPNIGLRGVLFAHDRFEDDGLIDDLGPATLTGNWGIADASDPVTGEVPEPPTELLR
jgi:hypothetical protein